MGNDILLLVGNIILSCLTITSVSANTVKDLLSAELSMSSQNNNEDEAVPYTHSVDICRKIKELDGNDRLIKLAGVKHGFGYGVSTPAQKVSIENMTVFLYNILK